MNIKLKKEIAEAKKAAVKVLIHNFKLDDPAALPMASSWGYFEAYTRDILISFLGIICLDKEDYEEESNYQKMIDKLHLVLKTLAQNQTERGHIPSIVNEKHNRGASDTTPLFIFAATLFNNMLDEIITNKNKNKFFNGSTNETLASIYNDINIYLKASVEKAKTWMEYQSPDDGYLVAQLETTDWRDELWRFQGYCLFVNTIVYGYLRLSNDKNDREKAEKISKQINQYIPFGLLATHENFYVMCVNKQCIKSSINIEDFDRWFDLLGNSLAIILGIAPPKMIKNIINHVEKACQKMQKSPGKKLTVNLPPNFFPFVTRNDLQWCDRYEEYGKEGNYLNGGIWPFTCGFYIAALAAANKSKLAEKKLIELTKLMKFKREPFSIEERKNLEEISFGFNEWFKSQNDWFNGQNKIQDESFYPTNEWFKARDDKDDPIMGHNWQTWTAALYLYAVKCVETKGTPFFNEIRKKPVSRVWKYLKNIFKNFHLKFRPQEEYAHKALKNT